MPNNSLYLYKEKFYTKGWHWKRKKGLSDHTIAYQQVFILIVHVAPFFNTLHNNDFDVSSAQYKNKTKGTMFAVHVLSSFSLYQGLVTLTSFGQNENQSSSVFTHSEHQGCNIKTLQSLWVSHKIVETYRNQHAPEFSKGENGNDQMCQWQHWPVSSLDVTPSENRPEHLPSAMSMRDNGPMRYVRV
jgi:hypothetical protein